MRRRSLAETLAAIVEAFHESRTWSQSALAARVGVEPRRIKGMLDVLIETKCFPLERSTEGRLVYWSLPKGWVAGGVVIATEDIAPLARILAGATRTAFSQRLLGRVLASAPPRVPRPVEPDTVSAPTRSDREDAMLALAESGAAQRVTFRVRYRTLSRNEVTDRSLSVQRILAGQPTHLLAHCHRSNMLKTFRVDQIEGGVLDPGVAFIAHDVAELDDYVAQSVDGFHGPAIEPVTCRFRVRDPEAAWVARNLPSPMRVVRGDGGVEVTVETRAVEQVARFVVGLGAKAVALTPELQAAVRTLAEGALAALDRGAPLPV